MVHWGREVEGGNARASRRRRRGPAGWREALGRWWSRGVGADKRSGSPIAPAAGAPPLLASARPARSARRRPICPCRQSATPARLCSPHPPLLALARPCRRSAASPAGDLLREASWWPRQVSRPVVVAASEEEGGESAGAATLGREGSGGMERARSLTVDDLEELKGCVDLGFGFNYHEIPELCGMLPALELCYSVSRRQRARSHSR
uniref:Uncharacterized protein n=1 Tax=Setaria viridis TaxID=4556 RepID=A0A4U6VTE8_SETVI|nr:hypothetical protein SEVIR_2G152800v2 [Setaria viridis]